MKNKLRITTEDITDLFPNPDKYEPIGATVFNLNELNNLLSIQTQKNNESFAYNPGYSGFILLATQQFLQEKNLFLANSSISPDKIFREKSPTLTGNLYLLKE